MRLGLIGLIAIVMVALAPARAAADPPTTAAVDRIRAQDAMATYFEGEIGGGYLLAGMGAVGLVAGGLLYRQGSSVARGAAYPLLGIGALHLAAGIYVGVASSRRIDRFGEDIQRDPAGFVARERVRMTGVARTFTALKIAEVALIVGGLAAAGVGWRTERPRLQGAGLALALEASLTLGFDVIAAQRAGRYREALAQTRVAAAIDPATGTATAGVTYAGRF